MLSQYEKPQIVIARTPDAPAAWIRMVCAGIEEEMIPYRLRDAAQGSPQELAFAAAQSSRLEVGLALTADTAVLHYAKLGRDEPLFLLRGGECSEGSLLALGANAARLVKGVPFKES